jgi:glycosyltransferase involved in cell wall biosynthesis
VSASAGSDHGWSELQPGISAVVPVFDSQESLAELVSRVLPILATLGNEHEVILVDDGSTDGSWAVVEYLAASNPHVVGFRLMRNFGQHNALILGIRRARYDVVVTMDDDLQHPPEEIPKLVVALNEGYDVVYGTPEVEMRGLWRKLAGRVTRIALQQAVGGNRAVINVSAFRAFRTPLRNAFETYQSPFASVDVLLAWGTTRFSSVSVRQDPRAHGTSTYNFRRLVTHGSNMLTGFSTRPLLLVSLLGFSFTVFGFVVLAYVLLRYLIQGGSVPGFSFLASIVALFSGVQLFSLGVMGEYLSRMHFRLLDRPTYVVAESTASRPLSDGRPLNEAQPAPGNSKP